MIIDKEVQLKNTIEHWEYSYNHNQTFTNESNFSIKLPIMNWYAI